VKHFLNLLAFLFWHILLDVAYDNRLAETEDWEYTLLILFIFIKFLCPVHTGNEVKFNTVDFVEPATKLNVQLCCRFVRQQLEYSWVTWWSVTSHNKSIDFKVQSIRAPCWLLRNYNATKYAVSKLTLTKRCSLTLLEVSRLICRPRVKGIPTYMLPKVKGYTDIYVILTYTGTETDASFGLFIPEIHFFWQGLKFYSSLKG